MDQASGPAIGERVAKYRRLNRMSAQELAERAGNGLTRSVVANLENGRRERIAVEQVVALARALDVPPVALLVPLERAGETVTLAGANVAVTDAVAWFQNLIVDPWNGAAESNARREVGEILWALEDYLRLVARVRDGVGASELTILINSGLEGDLRSAQRRLARAGVHVDVPSFSPDGEYVAWPESIPRAPGRDDG